MLRSSSRCSSRWRRSSTTSILVCKPSVFVTNWLPTAALTQWSLLLGSAHSYFPFQKNTSHITQPLDEAPFAALQADKVRRNEAAVMDGMLTNTVTRESQ